MTGHDRLAIYGAMGSIQERQEHTIKELVEVLERLTPPSPQAGSALTSPAVWPAPP